MQVYKYYIVFRSDENNDFCFGIYNSATTGVGYDALENRFFNFGWDEKNSRGYTINKQLFDLLAKAYGIKEEGFKCFS